MTHNRKQNSAASLARIEKAGAAAFAKGLPKEQCPHRVEPGLIALASDEVRQRMQQQQQRKSAWLDGWCRARREAEERKIDELQRKAAQTGTDPTILLMPNVPKPLHGLNPRTLLGDAWWREEKGKALLAFKHRCAACGVDQLSAKGRKRFDHHEEYVIDYATGRMTYRRTVPLCGYCHQYIHSGLLGVRARRREIRWEEVYAILDHGDAILDAAGLEKPTPRVNPLIKWSDWRLVIGDVEYAPLFDSYDAWAAHFHGEPDDAAEPDV